MKEEVMSNEEEKEAFTTQLRKSFRSSHKLPHQLTNETPKGENFK
jgi:hypothetical protein